MQDTLPYLGNVKPTYQCQNVNVNEFESFSKQMGVTTHC